MAKGKKLVLLVVLLLLTVGSYTLISKNLAATGTDQNGNAWTYTTSGSTITITKYNTTNKDTVTVPRPMTINGTSYSTVILNGGVFKDHTEITSLTLSNGIKSGTNCSEMFRGLTNITTLNLNNFDTSSATNMSSMFRNCSNLTSLNLTNVNFNTSNVTGFNNMFYDCLSLTSINFGNNFKTSNAANMGSMFRNCKSLTNIDLSNFDTTNAPVLSDMFAGCTSLELLDLSSFKSISANGGLFPQTIRIRFGNETKIEAYSGFLMRGTWMQEETGEFITSSEIYIKLLNKQAAGTYRRVSNISKEMKIKFPIDYKITRPVKNQTIVAFNTTTNNIVYREFNSNNVIYISNLTLNSGTTVQIPGEFSLQYNNIVSDKDNNKYNLKMIVNNINIKNISTSNVNAVLKPITVFPIQVRCQLVSSIPNTLEEEESISDQTISVNYDITLQIVDNNGNVKDGNFIFSAYDLDVSSPLDLSTGLPDHYVSTRGYGMTSEGINLGAGMDLSTLTKSNPTFLQELTTSDGKKRLTGTRGDSGTELSEFLVKADASGASFTFTGTGGVTDILSYYQPKLVEINKKDNHGNSVAGAKLQLYYGDELYNGPGENEDNTWITTNDVKKIFLMPGEYTLKEVTHPNQYESSEDITFFVDINDKLTINNEEVNDIEMIDNLVKKKYKVNYLEKGTNKILSPQKVSSDTEYGTTINSNDEKIDITNYKFDSSDKSSITIDIDESKNIINLYYTRVEKTVTINKLVYGNMADTNKEFNFNVEVKDIDGVIDNNRSTSFELKSNEVKTISIPIGYTIKVSEEVDNNYITTVNNSNTNTITKVVNDNEEITFKNTYNDSSSTGIISIITPYLLLIIVSIILIGGYSFVSNRIKV